MNRKKGQSTLSPLPNRFSTDDCDVFEHSEIDNRQSSIDNGLGWMQDDDRMDELVLLALPYGDQTVVVE